jgi:hypothetical protein
MDLPMDALGVVLGALFVAALIALPLTIGRRRLGRYFMKRDRAMDQRAAEIWMGGATDGYVPHPDFGPSPRERLRSPEVEERD